jgi:hypothetical protein
MMKTSCHGFNARSLPGHDDSGRSIRFRSFAATAVALTLASLAGGSLGCGAPDAPSDQPASALATGALTAPRGISAPIGAAAAAAAAGPTLPTYNGGAVISPELVTLYWGTFTQAEQDAMQAYIAGLANYISGPGAPFGQEPTVRAYGVYGATVGSTFRDTTLPSRGGVSGHAIQVDAQNKISALQTAGSLPAYSPERVFVVFSKGITWDQSVGGGGYGVAWCAYHGAFAGNQYFSIDPLPSVSGCGSTGFGGFTQNQVFQAQASHEILEAATDPGNGATTLGWAPEIGDGCNWGPDSTNMVSMSFGTVQKVADRLQSSCSTYTFQQGPGSSVVSWAPGRLDVFALGGSHQAYHRSWSGSAGWQPAGWEPHGGVFMDNPVATSWAANRLDVFGEGTDHAYFHQWWDGSAWGPSQTSWEYHAGSFNGPPAVTTWSANRIDIFGRSTDGSYAHQAYDGAWHPSVTTWEPHGGVFISPPTMVSWGANRLDIFGQGTDGAYYHQAWDGAAWRPSQTGWEPHGGSFIGPPVVVSWGANRLDLFGQGTDGAYYHQAWDGSAWFPSQTTWEFHGGGFIGQPVLKSWGPNRIDIFGQGLDRAYYHQSWSGAWGPSQTGWEFHGGLFATGPSVTTFNGANTLIFFGSQTDGSHYIQDWTGSAWSPSITTYVTLGNLSGL